MVAIDTTYCGPCGNVICSQYGCQIQNRIVASPALLGHCYPPVMTPPTRDELKEADLKVVNRTLGEVIRKQEEEIKELRATLLVAAGALKIAGYHESAERCMDTWRKQII